MHKSCLPFSVAVYTLKKNIKGTKSIQSGYLPSPAMMLMLIQRKCLCNSYFLENLDLCCPLLSFVVLCIDIAPCAPLSFALSLLSPVAPRPSSTPPVATLTNMTFSSYLPLGVGGRPRRGFNHFTAKWHPPCQQQAGANKSPMSWAASSGGTDIS